VKILTTLIIAITSYFLFFSSSSADEEWVEDQNGCLISTSSSTPTIKEATWTGECKDGYASGEGNLKVIWSEEHVNLNHECTGSMNKGEIHGQAKCKISGSITSGSWEHGQRNGFSTTNWSDGTKYVGTWKDDKMVAGIHTSPKGTQTKLKWFEEKNGCLVWNAEPQPEEQATWDGECPNGYANGKGTLTFLSKDMEQRYVGEIKNGKKEGQGTFYWLKHNKPCDEKKNIFNCYKNFVGKFTDDQFDKGIFTLTSGKKVEGQSFTKRRNDRYLADLRKVMQDSFEVEMEIRSAENQTEQWELFKKEFD